MYLTPGEELWSMYHVFASDSTNSEKHKVGLTPQNTQLT